LKVGELRDAVCFELEVYPEPKALSKGDLQSLMRRFRSTVKVAKHWRKSGVCLGSSSIDLDESQSARACCEIMAFHMLIEICDEQNSLNINYKEL